MQGDPCPVRVRSTLPKIVVESEFGLLWSGSSEGLGWKQEEGQQPRGQFDSGHHDQRFDGWMGFLAFLAGANLPVELLLNP